jgi:hypothetical protein
MNSMMGRGHRSWRMNGVIVLLPFQEVASSNLKLETGFVAFLRL